MPQPALRELIGLAGLAAPEAGQIRVIGDEPVFPTPYRIAASGAAALAAAGYAAAELWRLRSGRRQRIEVDARAAAASLRSTRYLQVDDRTPDGPQDPLSGFYPVRDGRWISIHCNFPNHRDAALKVLGAEQIARLSMETESPLGRIRHLRPVAILAETPARWTRPPVPLGHDRPVWEDAISSPSAAA